MPYLSYQSKHDVIIGLFSKEKQMVISKISTTRQKLILKYLGELPFLEDTFSNFSLPYL